jgi:hypothetical protein
MQYPPGTGFALALFREGFQVVPLYVLANLTILAFALLALFRAREPASLALAAVFGLAALYLMINPSKASYSVPPTMMVCAAAGFLTVKYFAGQPRHRLLIIALIGLLIGLSVNFRLPTCSWRRAMACILPGHSCWRAASRLSCRGHRSVSLS